MNSNRHDLLGATAPWKATMSDSGGSYQVRDGSGRLLATLAAAETMEQTMHNACLMAGAPLMMVALSAAMTFLSATREAISKIESGPESASDMAYLDGTIEMIDRAMREAAPWLTGPGTLSVEVEPIEPIGGREDN